jgi:predicted nuclease of predicted toxin-antitoxin system
MKLLLDQGLPHSAAALLRNVDIDTVHTGEVGLGTVDDSVIIEWARFEERVIVTLDADFHAQLALTDAVSPSAIRIRIEGLRAQAICELLQTIISDWHDELDTGVVMTVQPGRIRFRYLPLSSKVIQ